MLTLKTEHTNHLIIISISLYTSIIMVYYCSYPYNHAFQCIY